MTGDIQQSEDIVQEVFLKIWIHRDKMQHVNNFNGYIHMIIRNHILTQISDRKREQFNLREYGKLQSTFTPEVGENSELIEKEQIVKEGVKQLAPKQQLVYILKREYGWKREQIAKELKISPLTVKAHIQKAIKSVSTYVSKRIER